jgi:hypothetical protein
MKANPTEPDAYAFSKTNFTADGLSKRELFSAMAMQGLCSTPLKIKGVETTMDKVPRDRGYARRCPYRRIKQGDEGET